MVKQCDSESMLFIHTCPFTPDCHFVASKRIRKSLGSVTSEQLSKSIVSLCSSLIQTSTFAKILTLTLVFAFRLVLVGVSHSTTIGIVVLLRKCILLYFDCTSSVV